MNPALTTEEALRYLAEGRVRQVYLIRPGHFAVMVTYDSEAQELIFAKPCRLRHRRRMRNNGPISIVEMLVHTTPLVFDLATTA